MSNSPQYGANPPVINELRDSPGIDYVEYISGKFELQADGDVSLLYIPAEGEIQPGPPELRYDNILVCVQDGVMELGPAISFHSFEKGQQPVDLLIDVVLNNSSSIILDTKEVIQKLQKSGISLFETPQRVAEILTNYAVRNSSSRVLDIATGYGTILDSASNKTESNSGEVTGIDIEPIACSISKNRVKEANVIRDDFLSWGD